MPEHRECSTTTCCFFMMKRLSNGINAMPGTSIFSHFSRVDRNKGDIERKGCMDFVELKRVDGHLFRKMTSALVIHLTNVSH